MTTLRPSSLRRRGGIERSLPVKSIDISSDSIRSSRWWPSAILLQPSSWAAL